MPEAVDVSCRITYGADVSYFFLGLTFITFIIQLQIIMHIKDNKTQRKEKKKYHFS